MKLAKSTSGPEIFLSVQGEGPSAGLPSVFVRCSLCNLYCVWCDTDYTWNWQATPFRHARDADAGYQKYQQKNEIVDLSVTEAAELVAGFDCRNVVLTGGEPMIQQKDCQQLLALLRSADTEYRFEVETNGTILPDQAFHQLVDQYNVSVKLSNSAVPANLRLKSEVVEFFVRASADFKFVIESEQDVDEVDALVERFSIPACSVYLMPEGQASDVLRTRSGWLIETCKIRGFRFSDRLHIHLYGAGRGI